MEMDPAQQVLPLRSPKREKERIRNLLQCVTGHSDPRHLEQALEERGADDLTLQMAKDFSRKEKTSSQNLAALEPLSPDIG